MGYECPVCDAEEADGEHLANHLAFTALVRGGDHEAFLDEHVPDWADRDPESLASDVTPHATETDTEPVTEAHDHEVPAVERGGRADLSGDAAAILDEAQALTSVMQESSLVNPDDGDGETARDGADDEAARDGADDETARDGADDETAMDDAGSEAARDDADSRDERDSDAVERKDADSDSENE